MPGRYRVGGKQSCTFRFLLVLLNQTFALLIFSSCLPLAHSDSRAQSEEVQRHIEQGFKLGKEGSWPKAIAELQEAVKLDPFSAEAHYSLGVAYWWTKQREGAAQELRQALNLKPHFP